MDPPPFRQSATAGLVTCSPLGDRSGRTRWADEDCAESSFGRVRTVGALPDGEKASALFISVPPGVYIVKCRFQCQPLSVNRRFLQQLDSLPHATKTQQGFLERFSVTGFCAALPANMVEDTLQEEGGEISSEIVAQGTSSVDSCEYSSASHPRQIMKQILRLVEVKKGESEDKSSRFDPKQRLVYWEEQLCGIHNVTNSIPNERQAIPVAPQYQSNTPKSDKLDFYMSHYQKLLVVPGMIAGDTTELAYLQAFPDGCLTPPEPHRSPRQKQAYSTDAFAVLVGIIASYPPSRILRLDYFELCPFRSHSILPGIPRLVPLAPGMMPDLSPELVSRILGYLDLKSIWRTLRCSRQWFSLATAPDAHLWRYLLRFRFSWYRDTSNPKELFCKFAKDLRVTAIDCFIDAAIEDGLGVEGYYEPSELYQTRFSDYGMIRAVKNVWWLHIWALVASLPPGEYKVRARVVAEKTDWIYAMYVAAFPKKDHEFIAQRKARTFVNKVFRNDDGRVWIHKEGIEFRWNDHEVLAQSDTGSYCSLPVLNVIQRDELFAVVEMQETLKVTELSEVYLGIRDTTNFSHEAEITNIGLDWLELVPVG